MTTITIFLPVAVRLINSFCFIIHIETVKALGSPNADFAYLAPAASPYQNWMPVKKFEHGKWKMKWKYYRQPSDERGDDDRQANGDRRLGR